MRILFVYPNVTRARIPQLGICMLSAVAKELGHECALYDLATIRDTQVISAFQLQLKRYAPDVLAVSCRSNEWTFVEHLFQSVDPGPAVKIFGGPHATVAPDEVLQIADVAVIGEGEHTFAELLKRIADEEDLSDVAGCCIKREDTILSNDMRMLIPDLDGLPMPNWGIFDDMYYSDSHLRSLFNKAKVAGTFEASRGCPYACTYCMNEKVRRLYRSKGRWRREKSPERVVQEMKAFRDRYGLDGVYLIDEVVLTKVDRLQRFRDLYAAQIGKPISFMERPENVTDEKVRLIREAGAQSVSIGIESGDADIRKNLLNRNYSQEAVVSAFQIANHHGLRTHAFVMIGFPGERWEAIQETYRLLQNARPNTVQTTIFYPLKGTRLFEKVVEEGLFDPSTTMPQTYYGTSCLNIPRRARDNLLRYQYYLTYYDSKIVRFLVYAVPGQLLFRWLAYLYAVSRKLSQRGFRLAFRTLWHKIKAKL